MQRADIDEIETVQHFMGINTVRKPLSRAMNEMGFSMNYFELDTGEAFSGALHTHHDQEELFYVHEGTATFELREDPDADSETIDIGPREAIHFTRDDVYQTGRNEHAEPVVGFALGVPGTRHTWQDVEAVLDCPECGDETIHSVVPAGDETRMPDADEMVLTCAECGDER